MKIYPNNFYGFLDGLKSKNYKALLLYGPNEALINHLFNDLKKTFNYEIQHKSGSEWLKSNNLAILLNSQSLFSHVELIRITEPGITITSEAISVICDQNSANLLIVVANELPPSSTLRKNFETNPKLLTLACYEEDHVSLIKFIENYTKNKNLSLSKEAMQYIASNFNNRQILKMELDKLHCWWIESKEQIGLKEVQKLSSQGEFDKIDELCFALIKKSPEEYFVKLDKVDFLNISPILVIRMFLKYYTNLYDVVLAKKFNPTTSVHQLVKEITPPIFFRYVDEFTTVAQNTSIKTIERALNCISNTEKELKSHNISASLIYEELFFNLWQKN